MTVDLFAGIPVTDHARSLDWYRRLFGAEPAFLATATEAVWEMAPHRWVYVEQELAHAGHARTTLLVPDLEARIVELAGRGLEPHRREDYGGGAVKVVYRDPDGNEFGFGHTQE
ncbi:VOC family protein [Nocardiopsis sp. MG754419]|uniref:VOC family protein n=1 Tax=Nocardiopsis sp. MG754419 TaxID=2259865 RepID=UPI001BACBE9A|nr:VOC family protein [Nocardiopsis sp. MG754419]MBR8743105.1 VOC family protein [Nocardiopsis sp. MG754419]